MSPNESRLSCGAELEGSQGEFYHTARKTFSGSLGMGRRQLQALLGCAPQVIARVRPRQERRGHSASLASRPDCDAEWTDAPNSPASPRPARNGTFTWKAPRIETNHP